VKVWLDDERTPPEGWRLVKTAFDAINLLATGEVEEISLDHDLGTDETGYDVLLWIEAQVAVNGFNPPAINIHTANASAFQKMILARRAIERMTTE